MRRADGTFHASLIVVWKKQTRGRPVGLRYYPEGVACRRAVSAQYPKAMGGVVILFGTVVFLHLTPSPPMRAFQGKASLLGLLALVLPMLLGLPRSDRAVEEFR